jgi:hypothetical protein
MVRPAVADVTQYTDRASFSAACSKLSTITFSGLAPSGGWVFLGYPGTLTVDGVTFQTPDSCMFVQDRNYYGSGAFLSAQQGVATPTISVTLPGGTTAIGADFYSGHSVRVTLATGQSYVIAPPPSFPSLRFFGFTSDTAIASISIVATEGADLDNVTYGQRIVPFAVTGVRLGLPRFVEDPHGRKYLSVRAYLQGQGSGDVTGQWFDSSQKVADIPGQAVALTPDRWTEGPELQMEFIAATIKGRLHLRLDITSPSKASSPAVDCSLTGFQPDLNGWTFSNSSNLWTTGVWWDPLGALHSFTFIGECAGMSTTARYYYVHSQWLPTNRRQVHTILCNAQNAGNSSRGPGSWESDTTRFSSYSSYDALLNSEAELVLERLRLCDPCAIYLSGGATGTAHCVLGVAGFECDSAYIPQDAATLEHPRLVALYDPNFVHVYRYLIVVKVGNSQHLRFLNKDLDYVHDYDYDWLGRYSWAPAHL